MATKDFSAKQIRASQLLASGGISGTTAGLAIYSASNASNLEGGLSDANIFSGVGSDVLLFVSGAANQRSSVSLFGGDVVISGTLYAERQIIEVDETTSGSLSVSGSLYVQQGAQINLEAGSTYPDNTFQITSNQGTAFAAYGSPADVDASQPAVFVNPANAQIDFFVKTDGSKSAIVVDAQREYIAFMSGGTGDIPGAPNPRTMSDVNFLVSGSIGGKGSSNRGVAVFNGDVVTSGTLYPGGNSNLYIQGYNDGTTMIIESNDNLYLRVDDVMQVNLDVSNVPLKVNTSGVIINDSSTISSDFRVESDNLQSAILVDSGDNQIVIGSNNTTAAAENLGTDVVLFVSGTSGQTGGKGTSGGATVIGNDLIVSGTYRGGYDALAGYESFQAVSDNYLFLTSLTDFDGSQIEATDSNFFFTGSIGSRGGGTPGTAVFGGDVVASGSLIAEEQVRGKETYTLGPFYRQLSSTTEGIANYSNSTLDTASPNGDSWQHSHQWVAPCSGTLRAVSCMSYGTPGSAGNPTPSKVIFAMRKNIFFGGAYPEPTTHFSASMRDNSGIRVGAISNGISAVFNAVDGGSTPATDSDYGSIEQTISGSAPFSFVPGDVIFLSVKPETSQAGWYFTCNFILELETQKIK